MQVAVEAAKWAKAERNVIVNHIQSVKVSLEPAVRQKAAYFDAATEAAVRKKAAVVAAARKTAAAATAADKAARAAADRGKVGA